MSIDFDAKLNSLNPRVIDTQNVSEVAKQIFTSAQKNSESISEKFDLSKFKRVDLGLEVYGNQISTSKATQIAIRQAGLDIQLNQSVLQNVQYLNTQAALSSNKDMTKNVTGKIYAQVAVNESDKAREVVELPKSSNVFDVSSLAKDKTGSNGLLYNQTKNGEDREPKEENKALSIFA